MTHDIDGIIFRYNLLREESEGYAKMITALNGHGKMGITTDTVPALVGPAPSSLPPPCSGCPRPSAAVCLKSFPLLPILLRLLQTKYLQCLIGYFDLDPNRVFDAILEAYEHQPDNRAYLEVIHRCCQD